jgi:hypothetical protein
MGLSQVLLIWNNTAPDSDKFYLGSSGDANASGQTSVAYCFADVKGFSKFGSYTGNGSTDGTFVYTGFKPAFVMYKNTTMVHLHIGICMIIKEILIMLAKCII